MRQCYSMNWEGSSKRRLCTNEVRHHRQRIPLSTHSFRMLPTRHYYEVQDSTTISGSLRCSKPSFLRRLKDSLNSWRITILKQVSQRKQSPIGITLVKAQPNAQPMWKRLPISGKGSHYSRRSPRHLITSSKTWICTSP